jgi:hypothetical protein
MSVCAESTVSRSRAFGREAFDSGRPLPDWGAGRGIRADVNCCICMNNFTSAVPSMHCSRVRKKIVSARQSIEGVMREVSALAARCMPLVLDRHVFAAGCQSADRVRRLEQWPTTFLQTIAFGPPVLWATRAACPALKTDPLPLQTATAPESGKPLAGGQ